MKRQQIENLDSSLSTNEQKREKKEVCKSILTVCGYIFTFLVIVGTIIASISLVL